MSIRPIAILPFAILVFGAAACSDETGTTTATTCSGEECDLGSVRDSAPQNDAAVDQPTDTVSDVAVDTAEETDAVEEVVELEPVCDPETRTCFSEVTAALCGDDGQWIYDDCDEGSDCEEGGCVPRASLCEEGDSVGCADDTHYLICNAGRTGFDDVVCPDETPNCIASLGECSDLVCVSGSRRCGETDNVEQCSEDGSSWDDQGECDHGTVCDRGGCLSPCDANAKLPSFLGCNYWALDLDNLAQRCDLFAEGCDEPEVCDEEANVCEPSAASQSFAVSLSNPHNEEVVVTILNQATGDESEETVGPETSSLIALDRLDVDGTGVTRNAFQITTTLPITAHQFNPAANVAVFSNDASLLLPSNVAGLTYIVLGWPTGPYGDGTQPISDDGSNQGAFAYTTVVNVSEDPAEVTVTPSVAIRSGSGVDAIEADERATITLQPGDVLNLETEHEEGLDLTGTVITSTQPISVYAGHECAFVPSDPLNPYCDHIEQQLFPVEAWGTEYIAGKLSPRGTEVDVWRIVASEDGTLLRTTPPIVGVNGTSLDRGESLEFLSDLDFRIEGSAPISVGQFMVGSNYPGIEATCPASLGSCDDGCPTGTECHDSGVCVIPCARANQCRRGGLGRFHLTCADEGFCAIGGEGDPAFLLSVPTSQYRDDYVFLTPGGYAHDWITILAPEGTRFQLDGSPLDRPSRATIGSTGWDRFYVDMSDGGDEGEPHTLTGTAEFGLQVYGYDCDVSYGYPGGLNLATD